MSSETSALYAFRRNVVLVASAGTGKTHALVGVLLHALLGVSELAHGALDPARVCATTFSRKAAAEIRERLVSELERLSLASPSAYDAALAEAAARLSIRFDERDRVARARTALARIEYATIGTLHGLAYGIARSHALAVGLPPAFTVASEIDTETWATEAVTAAMSEHANRDPVAIRDFLRLMRGTERAQVELVRLLLAIEEDGRAASSLTLPEGDDEAFDAQMRLLVEQARRVERDARCASVIADLLDAYARKDVLDLVKWTTEIFTMRRARGEGPWIPMRDDLPGTTNRDRAEFLVFGWAARARSLPTASLVRSLLVRAQERLSDSQARAGAVGFGAALRLARDALRDDPIAAARVSQSYDALLVDEFQDTSRVQVELVRLLWERNPRARAKGAMPVFGDMRERGLLVVGDRKQSIYAFRGADVGVFVTTCVELAGERARVALDLPEGTVAMPARTTADFFALRENRRSNDALIDHVNEFSRLCLRPDGDDLSEARYSESIESLLPADTTRHVSGLRVTWLKLRGEPRDTTRLEDASMSASYIANTVGELGDDGSALSFRDFAILAQSNEMLDASAFALSRVGIPHVVAGRGFFATREVQDLLALLRWLDRPEDRSALLAVLRGPCAALSDRTLLALTETHRGLVTDLERWDTLDRRGLIDESDRPALDRVKTTLRALRRSSERLGPARTLHAAIRELEIEQSLVLLPRGVQRVANVRKLVRLAEEETTIRALLDRVARAEERAREPEAATFSEDDDAVRLVTLHASKGLAFRIVLLPELRGSPIRSANTTLGLDLRTDPAWLATKILDDRGEPVTTPSIQRLVKRDRARLRADRRRLMYVAVTRARERIVFVGNFKTARSDPSFSSLLPDLPVEHREALADFPLHAANRKETTVGPLVVPRAPRTVELAIAPTALQDFGHCARRFELVHLVALPEPTPAALGRFREDGAAATNARAEGEALHRVLERVDLAALGGDYARDHAERALASTDIGLDPEAAARVLVSATRFLTSDYARTIRDAGAEIWRERAFVIEIASPDIVLTLRGAMDFVAQFPNGDVDVVDYKRARSGDTRPHALQLDVYALAASRFAPENRVRAGAIFLGGDAPAEPRFRPPITPSKLEARLLDLAASLLRSRRTKSFPRAPAKICHAIGCGYFTLCHPKTEKRQLTLFR